MTKGIRVSQQGKSVDSGFLSYDTKKSHLQVNPNTDPAHIKLITINGGTVFPSGSSNQLETLYQVAHKQPFTPKCTVFFYITAVPADFTAQNNSYVGDFFSMSGTSPQFQDFIYYKVDAKYFYIRHYFTDNSTNGVAESNQFTFRIKYMIHENAGNPISWPWDA